MTKKPSTPPLPDDLSGTIRGVVEPRPARIYPGPNFWTRNLVFSLMAWRHNQGAVRDEYINVGKHVLLGTAMGWRARIRPGSTIAFESDGLEVFPQGGKRVKLTRLLGEVEDAELAQATASRLTAQTIETAEFGTFVAEPGSEISVRCDWHGRQVDLEVSGDDDQDAVEQARALYAGWQAWEAQLLELLNRELVPLWADWNPEETPIDAKELYRRLRLYRLLLTDRGEVWLSFDAAGEFTDHEVQVSGTVGGGPDDISIEG